MGVVEESAAVREGEVDDGGDREDKCAGYVKSTKRLLPKACPLGEAQVVEVRRVERFEIDRVLHERLGEDLKDPAQLEAGGAEQRFVAEDDVKNFPE